LCPTDKVSPESFPIRRCWFAAMSALSSKSQEGSGATQSFQDTSAWLKHVHSVQTSRLSPEQREELKARAEKGRVREQQRKKCKAISSHALRSNVLACEGLRQMASCEQAADFSAAASRWHSAQDASEVRQKRRIDRVEGSKAVAATVDSASDSDAEEEEGWGEMAAIAGASDVQALNADRNRLAVVSVTPGAPPPAGATTAVEELLKQVRIEPSGEEECAAKFSLYEGYSQQLEKIRALLFEFYEESAPTVPPNIGRDWQRQLKKLDSHEAMGIVDDDGRIWFVYHMMKTTERNNRVMTGTLEGFQRKIELLAKNDQAECPVCLEPFTEVGGDRAPETLSCCHKICEECWEHWKRTTHGSPFCPLCRNEEFLDVITGRASTGGI